jgi:hypothetical protein
MFKRKDSPKRKTARPKSSAPSTAGEDSDTSMPPTLDEDDQPLAEASDALDLDIGLVLEAPTDDDGVLEGEAPPPGDDRIRPTTFVQRRRPSVMQVYGEELSLDEAEAVAAALANLHGRDESGHDSQGDSISPSDPDSPWSFVPTAPKTVEETGIPQPFLRELLLKVLWAYDKSNPSTLVNVTGLHGRVVEELMEGLNREGLVEIDSIAAQAKSQFTYRLGDRGKNAAHEALDRSRYVGVAPVPVSIYNQLVEEQIRRFKRPPLDEIRAALDHLVLPERLVEIIGQAFFSRRALMVYGPSGNGKTDIVTSIASVVAGTVIIPYALYGHGQLIRVFDPDVHKSQVDDDVATTKTIDGETVQVWAGQALRHDRRWLPVSRPTVVVGGDMGAEALDMTYDATQGVHNAPLSVVAQGGVLVIDDLGRQKISPKEILNRWVIMMEQGFDAFALGSSEIVRLPLDVTLVFSTNLTLHDLMDEAYLRRIAYKIAIPGPTRDEMLEIARRTCDKRELAWTEETIHYLVERCYAPGVPEPKGCYPRDIITTVVDEAEFQGRKPVLDKDSIDTACTLYFGVGPVTEQAA